MAEEAPCPSLPAPHNEVNRFHALHHAAYGNLDPDDAVDLDRRLVPTERPLPPSFQNSR
jgi:hypothetical protein